MSQNATPEHVELAKVFLDEVLSHKFWKEPWGWLAPKQKNEILDKFLELSSFALNAARANEKDRIVALIRGEK